jgi:XapX domain-containing protein
MKMLFGLLLAFVIGIVCRLASLPFPAPRALTGAGLVLAMSSGYEAVARLAPIEGAPGVGTAAVAMVGHWRRFDIPSPPPLSWSGQCWLSP